MKIRWSSVLVAALASATSGAAFADEVQWVRVTVLLERGSTAEQKRGESLIRGGIYSVEEVERRGLAAIDAEILERVQFLAGKIHDVEETMRVGDLASRQYYLPLQVGRQAVVPVIDLNPRLGIVVTPKQFFDDRIVSEIQFLVPEGPSGVVEYTGEPITLTLKEADIRDVIGVFGKLTQTEIIFDESISGKVTVDLRNMPWDQALDVVLRTNGLGWETEGSALRVAPLDELSRRKKVRTEATVSLPRGTAGSATIASRGDEVNRTVVVVVENVSGEPEMVAERDGLLHPPVFAVTSVRALEATPMGDVLVFRGRATVDGDLADIQVLESPLGDKAGTLPESLGSSRPWTVLDKHVRRVEAVVGYGIRVTQAPLKELDAVEAVEHIGVDVEVGLPPPQMAEDYPDHHVISVYLKDLDSGEVFSAPRITVRKGEEGTVRSSVPQPDGGSASFVLKVQIAHDGGHVSYSWTVSVEERVIASHTAEFEL
jgi:hypothetical protein